MLDINFLNKRLITISSKIPKNQWKYINKKSIQNFINAIELVKDNNDKSNIEETLLGYFNDIELNFEPTIDYNIYLSNNYLKFIIPIYENKLGFIPIPNKDALWFISILIVFTFIILRNHIYFVVSILTIILSLLVWTILKYGKGKIFGFGY